MRGGSGEAGAVSVSLLLWVAVGGVLLYALFAAYFGDADRFGRVPVPGAATLELPEGETDISYAEQSQGDGADVAVPGDLEIAVVSTASGDAVELDPRGSDQSEEDGEVVRLYGSVNPPAAGPYEVRVSSREAAARPGPQLLFGESPLGAFGDRLSRVVEGLAGPVGVLLAALIVAAVVVPRLQDARRRRPAP
jgi:hypothetical protein